MEPTLSPQKVSLSIAAFEIPRRRCGFSMRTPTLCDVLNAKNLCRYYLRTDSISFLFLGRERIFPIEVSVSFWGGISNNNNRVHPEQFRYHTVLKTTSLITKTKNGVNSLHQKFLDLEF